MEFFTSLFFTPILNRKDFASALIEKDEQGLVRALETVAFPGTLFTGKKTNIPYILEVKTKSYPYKGPFYIDSRLTKKDAFEKSPSRPSKSSILKSMESVLGSSYVWGGNTLTLDKLSSFYPSASLEGFDCSGLIFFASNGTTPRNTSSWEKFGKDLPIEGKNVQEILPLLQPLDAILFKGHILFVFDERYTIESREGVGVVLEKTEKRLSSLIKEGKKLSIKRWYNS